MSSLNFKFVTLTLTFALFVSAAVPNKRSIQWLQYNGPAAKALNDHYNTLTTSSSCNDDGDIACVSGLFGTCLQGRYITHACPSGGNWSCAAVPNEWDEGTTTTCDTNDNISWRFSQAGVSEYKREVPDTKRSIQWLQYNGPAAQALNDQYQALNTSSSCNDDGQIACIDGQFATCYEGRYLITSCSEGWTCAAIPNEWDEGTTTTCDTTDNISWKFAQTGISEY